MLSRKTMRKASRMCTNITGIARRTLNARSTKSARKSVKALKQYGNSFALSYLKRLLLVARTRPGIRKHIPAYTRKFNRACTTSALKSLMSA